MTTPTTILNKLQKRIPDATLYRKFLVIGNSEDYILCGFIFERTITKGEYFVWAVMMPLYRSLGGAMLSYSSRLASGDRFILKDRDAESVTTQVIDCIKAEEWLDKFPRYSDPRELLGQIIADFDLLKSTQHSKILDIAILSFLSGDLAGCAAAARHAAELPPFHDWQDKFTADAKYIHTALKRDHDELRQWINKMHHESRTSLLHGPNTSRGLD